ncbi:MAG: hypothetical protein GY777_02290, partial [Candidatus Brocadiaceae bacterium]|nr:hypothetical protein [Candidatus Brocadiaceae bacterium]
DSGGTANSGDDTGTPVATSTVDVDVVNDEPTLTATGSDPTFTEGGSAVGLFSGAAVSTVESGQTITGLTFTVTNVTDTGNEQITIDGATITLDDSESGSTTDFSYNVSVSGTTATVTLSGGTASTASVVTDIDNATYINNSQDPTDANRVVTVTQIVDSGGTANSGDDTGTPVATSTVDVDAVNDEPTLTATGSDPTFTEGGSAVGLFSGAAVSTVESGQTITGLTFTVTNVTDTGNEQITIDGATITLDDSESGSTTDFSYSVSVSGTTATVTLSGGTASTAAVVSDIDNATYINNSQDPTDADRVVTITEIVDSGGTANSGDDTGTPVATSTVDVEPVNDEPTLTATGSDPTFTEGGSAVGLFSGAAVSTVESGQTITGLTFTVTNV